MPTVVLESGWGLGARAWDAVIAQLGEVPVVAHERRRRATATTGREVAADLEALLRARGARPPLVLAGHSLGGLFARIFAARHPGAVAGVVLVEASHEDQEQRIAAALPAALLARVEALRAGVDERVDFAAVAAEARAAGGLGDRPLVVVTGARLEGAGPPQVISFDDTFHSPVEDLLMYEALAYPIWRALQRDLLRLSTRARWVRSPRAGHGILVEDPGAVASAIRAVVAEVEVT